MRAQAEVDTVAEGHVLVAQPADVEPEGVLECGLVFLITRRRPWPDLAARANMSERTFLRRYKQATGATPAKAIERI